MDAHVEGDKTTKKRPRGLFSFLITLVVLVFALVIVVVIIVVIVLVLATLFDFLRKHPKFSEQLFKYLFYFVTLAFVFRSVIFAKAFPEFLATIIRAQFVPPLL